MNERQNKENKKRFDMPSVEKVQEELLKVESMDDFFGKDGIFAKLFANTIGKMLEAELSDHLGYEKYEAKGRNSGNNRIMRRKYAPRVVISRSRCPETAMAALSQKLCLNMVGTPMRSRRKFWVCTLGGYPLETSKMS